MCIRDRAHAVARALQGNLVAAKPAGLLELGVVDGDGRVSVHLAPEPHQERVGEAPRLALVEAQVLDVQAHLLHDLAADGVLKLSLIHI